MEIWTEEKRPEISGYQRAVEECLANAIYDHRAYKEHRMFHIFESAIGNSLFEPLRKLVEEGMHSECYPAKISITENDLKKLHRGTHGGNHRKQHFRQCLVEISKILEEKMEIVCTEPIDEPGILFIVFLSLKS